MILIAHQATFRNILIYREIYDTHVFCHCELNVHLHYLMYTSYYLL